MPDAADSGLIFRGGIGTIHCFRGEQEILDEAWEYRNDLMGNECCHASWHKDITEYKRAEGVKSIPRIHSSGGRFLRTIAEYDGADNE